MKLRVFINEKQYWLSVELEAQLLCKDLLELIEGYETDSDAGLFVDGHFFKTDTPLEKCQIFEGSQISLDPLEKTKAGLIIATTSGAESGQWVRLRSNSVIVGRSQTADLQLKCPTISPRHLLAKINTEGKPELLDLNSQNGTWIGKNQVKLVAEISDLDTRIHIGNSSLEFLRTEEQHLQKAFGHLLIDRVPNKPIDRPINKTSHQILKIPHKSKSIRNKISFSWAALIAPILFGSVMAVVFNPYMALFILMSPLMSIGSWLELKYRGRHSRIQLSRKASKEIHDFSKDLAKHRKIEILERQNQRLNPLTAIWSIQNRSKKIWERRPSHPKFLQLALGSCDLKWQPNLNSFNQEEVLEGAIKILEELEPLYDVPLELPTMEMEGAELILGILGPYDISKNLARWLVIQAALLHGPADLKILFSNPFLSKEWEWMNWLPHFENLYFKQASHLTVVDLYENHSTRNSHEFMKNMQDNNPNLVIVLAPNFERLLKECNAVIQIQDLGKAKLTISEPINNTSLKPINGLFKVDGISKTFATDCASGIARYKDPEALKISLPQTIELGELLDLSKLDLNSQILCWEKTLHGIKHKSGNLSVPIGKTHETLFLDLLKDGPHGLIAGTTGSGKSELLRSLVIGLAQKASPEIINFVLIDYKGGSAFDMLSELPHTVGMITDLTPNLGERALISLRCELTRREKILRSVRAEDLNDFYLKTSNAEYIPRLLIVIDEFASMAEELPDFLSSLVEIARRGRSLGIHLILATQRPSGVINANILANTNFRICLRTLSKADSLDVIDSKDAAFLPKEIPGRACIKIDASAPKIFQAARASSSTPPYLGPITLSEVSKAENSYGSSTQTDINKIVEITKAANIKLKIPTPHKPITELLPKTLHLESRNFEPDPKSTGYKNWISR